MSDGLAVSAWQVALVAAGALALLAFAVAQGWLSRVDHDVLVGLAGVRTPVLDEGFQFLTWLGSGYVLAPGAFLLMALFAVKRRWPAVALMGVGYFGASLTTWLLKPAVARERPMLHPALADFMGVDWSFPSGHATHAAAFAWGVWLLARESGAGGRPLAAIALVGVLLVAASRLYLQVHWPSDVLAGLLVATLWAGVAVAVARAARCAARSA